MKSRWIIGSILLMMALIFSLILFSVNADQMVTVIVNSKNSSTNRYLSNSANWKLWWPGSSNKNSPDIFQFRGDTYKLTDKFRNGSNLTINPNSSPISTHIRAFYTSIDSTLIQWDFSDAKNENFFRRIINHYKRSGVQKNMMILMDSLKSFMDDQDKVYHFHIERIAPVDTLLISTKRNFIKNPTTVDVYNIIGYLRQHLNKAKIKETGPPMMNVNEDSGFYKLMVAIPIEKPFNQSGDTDIKVKRMVPSKFVSVDVVGGPKTIEVARQQIMLYMTDFEKVRMAIPFESLVTDRIKSPDTSKWQTRIYYPSY